MRPTRPAMGAGEARLASGGRCAPEAAIDPAGALEQPEAARREKAGKRPCGNLPQGETGKTRDKVAAALGTSGKTYEKAKAVQASDPHGFTLPGGEVPRTALRRRADVTSTRPSLPFVVALLHNGPAVGPGGLLCGWGGRLVVRQLHAPRTEVLLTGDHELRAQRPPLLLRLLLHQLIDGAW